MRLLFVLTALGLGACATSTSTTAASPMVASVSSDTAPVGPTIGFVVDQRITAMLRDVDPRRIRGYDSSLVAFGTRNLYSDTISTTRGTGAARRWIHSQFRRFSADCGGCLRVEFDTATVATPRDTASPSRMVTNVLAWLPGRDTTNVIVIGGHFDSCVCAERGGSRNPTADAPGANDDGSGTAAVIELARVFSRAFPRGLDATVIFAAHDAEEQGLLGSRHLAQRLKAGGYHVIAGMTDDIVGNVTAEDGYVDSTSVRVFAPDPDTSKSRELARDVWGVGALYLPAFEVYPIWRLDRFGRGGDHTPFIQEGWAGVRFTERVENEKRQHRPADTLGAVNFGYIANVARLNAATIASLGLAPAMPEGSRAQRDVQNWGGRRWTLSWSPVPGAVAYEVLIRPTTSPQYERLYRVGADTSFLLNYQLDDAWAGVRAVAPSGHRSLPVVLPRVMPRPARSSQE
jgi:hypothetical protein